MNQSPRFDFRPLLWVPTLYLAMGIPFNVIMSGTAANMYKSLGYSNAQITVALGSIAVAWSLKPLWAAFLDMYRTKKFFVLSMELLLAVLFAAVALTLPLPGFFQISIAVLWIAAFASSTQDICADGIYLTALDKASQSRFAGVQSMFWVGGKILATGGFVLLMDRLRSSLGWSDQRMWQGVMLACASAMFLLFLYHRFLLPPGSITLRPHNTRQVATDFAETAATFFHKRAFWGMIAFVFLYRLGEGLILMEGQLFLRSTTASGGLGLTAGQVSAIDAVWGTIANIAGGLLGGWFVSRRGLSRSLWLLGLFLNVPHFTFVALSQLGAAHHGVSYATIATLVSIEKFGYGFGMVGNMIYMMQQLAPGRSTMTHYAFATALMNLVLVPTNMMSGPLGEWLGFSTYFLVVMAASVPSAWAAWRAPFPQSGLRLPGADVAEAAAPVVVHLDDPEQLSADTRQVQLLAGRASIYAMLQILVILMLDTMVLGWIHELHSGSSMGFIPRFVVLIASPIPGASAHPGVLFWAVLILFAVLKVGLAIRSFRLAGQAVAAAAPIGETNYAGNARGARIATLLCLAISAVVIALGAKLAL
jgi:PAT family beta-lactamase induction signal transducer AmpG